MAEMTIRLFCAAGMSTSILVGKMRETAKEQGKDYDIQAFGIAEFDREAPKADVILLGPQVAYAADKLKAAHPEMAIIKIAPRMYGMMDSAGVLKAAEEGARR